MSDESHRYEVSYCGLGILSICKSISSLVERGWNVERGEEVLAVARTFPEAENHSSVVPRKLRQPYDNPCASTSYIQLELNHDPS